METYKFIVNQAEVLVAWVPHLQLVSQDSLVRPCPYPVESVLTLDSARIGLDCWTTS